MHSQAGREADNLAGAIDGGPVQDIWFWGVNGNARPGPFKTIKEFNDWMQFWSLDWLPMAQRKPDFLRQLLPDSTSLCFTHADLHLGNIVISDDDEPRRVTAIVDWGQAGWYSEYWEYCKALLLTGNDEWFTEGWLLQVLRPYEDEYEAFGSYWDRKPA